MLEILLIRHGETDWNREQKIMGNRPIPLNSIGIQQAEAVGHSLRSVGVDAIYTSPLKRAVQTARAIARMKKIKWIESPEVAEIYYGSWIGKKFSEVREEPAYICYHTSPSEAQIPGGEKMVDVHARVVGFVERLRKKHEDGRIVVVSHADVIKTILVHYMNLHLNDILKFRIDNCSISLLWFGGQHVRVLGLNCQTELGHLFASLNQPPLHSPEKSLQQKKSAKK